MSLQALAGPLRRATGSLQARASLALIGLIVVCAWLALAGWSENP